MTTTVPLKAVTLTHVQNRKGDQLGHFLVPVFISLGGFLSHFIFRHELQGRRRWLWRGVVVVMVVVGGFGWEG